MIPGGHVQFNLPNKRSKYDGDSDANEGNPLEITSGTPAGITLSVSIGEYWLSIYLNAIHLDQRTIVIRNVTK